jgi:hypothetical protein
VKENAAAVEVRSLPTGLFEFSGWSRKVALFPSPFVFLLPPSEIPRCQQRGAQFPVGFGIVRFALKGLFEAAQRSFGIATLPQHRTEVDERIDISGSQFDRLSIAGDRFVESTQILKHESKIVMRVGIGRVDLKFAPARRGRFLEAIEPLQKTAAKQIEFRKVGFEPERFLQTNDCLVQLIEPTQNDPKLAEGLEAIRLAPCEFEIALCRLQQFVLLKVPLRHTQQIAHIPPRNPSLVRQGWRHWMGRKVLRGKNIPTAPNIR